MQSYKNKIKKIIENPVGSLMLLLALTRGFFYKHYYKALNRKVHIDFPFKAFSQVKISGEGSVYIARNCSVEKSLFKGLNIVTLSPTAKVVIGSGCNLQGLTIRCKEQIIIGDDTMTASTLIQDTPIVNFGRSINETNLSRELKVASIKIGTNVWLGGESYVLGGCNIGEDSVISAGAMCFDLQSKPYSLLIGNPAKRPLPISNLMKMKKKND